ncbi:MAG: dephospho-CoA kinase [Planctomycetaceae bacterium]|nr:dephospho-CoA kinase [Planctomycetaceae bacterium]
MRIIGIVGGVASGKSVVAEHMARLGAAVIDADQLGHEALRLPRVEAAARQRWGETVFGADGRIDRARVAAIVFGEGPKAERERKYLEKLTHPEIARRLWQQAVAASVRAPLVVLDAALLTETGWDKWCEKVVFVDAPREMRQLRAAARGWEKEDFAAREAAQESLDRKRERADVIIDNSGPLERTQAQVEQLWASLVH